MRSLLRNSEVDLPAELATLLDQIRTGLACEWTKQWHAAFSAALTSSTDLHRTWDRFAVWLMSDCKRVRARLAKTEIDFAILLYRQSSLIRPCTWRYADSRLTVAKFSSGPNHVRLASPIDVALACVQLKLENRPQLAAFASSAAAQVFASGLPVYDRSGYRERAYQRQANELLRLMNSPKQVNEVLDERDDAVGGICRSSFSSCKCGM